MQTESVPSPSHSGGGPWWILLSLSLSLSFPPSLSLGRRCAQSVAMVDADSATCDIAAETLGNFTCNFPEAGSTRSDSLLCLGTDKFRSKVVTVKNCGRAS